MTEPGAALAASPLHEAYRADIGRSLDEIPTPALVADLPTVLANLRTMRDGLAPLPAELRPHVKVHKCPSLARLQLEHGAIGVAVATPWEAAAMVAGGIDDVLVANEVAGREQLAALGALARRATITVAVDDVRGARDLAEAVGAAGGTVGVLIERDVGMARGGVRSDADGVALARAIAGLPALRLRGVQGYEGHCMLEPDQATRVRLAHEAMDVVRGQVEALRADGHEVVVVSGGGTGTWDITGANPVMTEIQAGSYCFMDLFHGSLVPSFARSLHVRSTVLMEHGATIVLDAGRKSIGIDFVQPKLRGHEGVEARYFAEEHALFDFPDAAPLRRGERGDLVPGYGPTTCNLYDVIHVAEGGTIVDVWPVIPRGPGRGLAAALA